MSMAEFKQKHFPNQNSPTGTLAIDLSSKIKSTSYSIQQPYIQISQEGYQITSVDQTEKFSAVRPRHIFKNIISRIVGGFLGVTAFVLTILGGFWLGIATNQMTKVEPNPVLMLFVVIVSLAVFVVTYIAVARSLAPKRKLSLFSPDNSKLAILSIAPTSGIFIFNHEYLIRDSAGKTQIFFRKSFFESFFRTKWHCFSREGKFLFSATEDSLLKALFRRYFGLARFIPMHFNFIKSDGSVFGEFTRKFSLKDRYKLNFSKNSADSWLILATALLLDTGENR
jgi:hypothetical protein